MEHGGVRDLVGYINLRFLVWRGTAQWQHVLRDYLVHVRSNQRMYAFDKHRQRVIRRQCRLSILGVWRHRGYSMGVLIGHWWAWWTDCFANPGCGGSKRLG